MFRDLADLDAHLADIRGAPADNGPIELIARRPAADLRETVDTAELDTTVGLVGDRWSFKPSKKLGYPNPEAQLTLMNIRAVRALAEPARFALAGDQLYVDLDLSPANLPPGSRLAIGDTIIEVSAHPHTGCDVFTERFGSDATKWVNSPAGRELNLRGINAKVIRGGTIKRGDKIRKL
jgi:hypothetical protein